MPISPCPDALRHTAVSCGNCRGERADAPRFRRNKFGQPKTVVHVVAYKFRDATSLNDQEQAIAGIKDMAAKIPGVKNIWLKTERNQLRDFNGVYVIEFVSPEAAADYAESPIHDAWRKKWEQLRENSLSFQVSN